MPEILEVEVYRRLAEAVVGREVDAVEVPDPHCLGDHLSPGHLRRALVGRRVGAARRRGKLLLVDTDGPVVGLRFGMTGGLVVDDRAAIERLLYSAGTSGPRWMRASLGFAGGGTLALHDPRRFGRLLLDPDEEALGPDVLSVSPAALRAALGARATGAGPALKARLLDQTRLAGIGNLLADEMLWRAGLSPLRPTGSLSVAEHRRLHRALATTLATLGRRGGSHTGDLMAGRRPGGRCPRDAAPLARCTVGGRTTWWCPAHQR